MQRLCLLALPLVALSTPALAQGTRADYERANTLSERLEPLILGEPSSPTWLGTGHRFWYQRSTADGNEWMLVNVDDRSQVRLFDHERMAAGLSAAADTTFTPQGLPFARRGAQLEVADDLAKVTFVFRGHDWECTLADYACAQGDTALSPFERFRRARDEGPRRSPDRQWDAFIWNYNLAIRPAGAPDDSMVVLSRDGSEGNYYMLGSIRWSPDSRKIMAYRRRPGYDRRVHYVESSPPDQVQPRSSDRFYRKPGDVVDFDQPVLFDVATRREIEVDNTLFPNAYDLRYPSWWHDSRGFTFEYNERGHMNYRVIEVDANTGAARTIIDERPQTFFNYDGTRWREDVDDGREIIWRSERDGWKHLWLYDGHTGRVKNQITRGNWVVRGVDTVDAEHRQIWFHASGMYPDQDPYLVNYYRIDFDGSHLVRYTPGDGNHDVSWSADHAFYLDLWSRVDEPPVLQVRRTSDRSLVMDVAHTDVSALLASGWRFPEVFVAKGRDDSTDIWGVIIRPTNFDSSRTYPVIEYIYAGPQGSFVPKTFSLQTNMQSLAELGFIVVQIDGMGTNNRSKAFHDVAWHNLGDAGFPDRIAWHRAVAARYAYYDTTRVGIYGTSAGGQNSTGALLFHPEFYDVAVSAAGCHDNRMDKIWWNELWMSWPVGPQYEASSNVVNAGRLQGHLLLIVGEMDTNVDPSSTLQVVNALIRADKDVDLLVIPGAGHTSGGAYGTRKRNDYFVRYLLGVAPPDWNADAATTRIGMDLSGPDTWLDTDAAEAPPYAGEWD